MATKLSELPTGQKIIKALDEAVVVRAFDAVPAGNVFQVQPSDSSTTGGFIVQSDLGVIINQVTGATYAQILDAKYLGTTQFSASFNGEVIARAGFNGGSGFFTTDISGNVVALGNITGKHLLGNGTSPTVADNGGNDSTIAGKDTACKVTVGTGSTTTITITFGTAYATAPVCVVSGSVSSDIKVATTTTTAVLTHAGFTDAEVLHVVCIGF